MARRAFQVPRRPWGAAALPRWGGLAAVLGLAVTLARGAEGAEKCNHTDLVWDASRTGVGIPATCSDLSLVDESIGDAGASAIAQHLDGGAGGDGSGGLQLRTLDLYENHIGDDGAKALAAALAGPFSTLKELYLWGNAIGNSGAAALAKALESNTKLEALVLWNNKIGDAGADDLLRALDTNTHITKLYLTGNKV